MSETRLPLPHISVRFSERDGLCSIGWYRYFETSVDQTITNLLTKADKATAIIAGYHLTGGGTLGGDVTLAVVPFEAFEISYDNSVSLLVAIDVQAALDEILAMIPSAADEITYDNGASGLSATDVQAALDEIAASVAGAGSGDVVGPASATDSTIALFDGVTGKLLKDSAKTIDTDGALAANSDARVATQKAVKSYVDAVVQGLSIKNSCLLATAAALPANNYSNGASGVGATLTAVAFGALTIDGVVVALGNRVLVKDEVSTLKNGIYTVTTLGALAVLYVLTRVVDFDTSAEILPGSFTFIEEGTANTGAGFVLTTVGTIVVGTTGLTFTQFSGAGEITVGAALTKTGNLLDRAALTGNVTAPAGSNVTTIPAATITNAMHANMVAYSFKVNLTAGAAAPTDAIYTDFTTKATPVSGDFVIGFDSGGIPKKYDIATLPAGAASPTGTTLMAAILALAPTAYWPCDDASGVLVDHSGNGYDLTVVGTPTYQWGPLIPTEATKYLHLNNTTDGASRTSALGTSPPLVGDWTIIAFSRPDGEIGGTHYLYFSLGDNTSATIALNLQAYLFRDVNNGLKLSTLWEFAGPTAQLLREIIASYVTGTDPKTEMIAAVKDGTANDITFYKNGHRVGRVNVTYSNANEPTGGTGAIKAGIGYDGLATTATQTIGHVAFFNGTKVTQAQMWALARAAGVAA